MVATPAIILHVINEERDDDRVLECALAGKADYVVSGDRHLLKLGSYESILIVTARQFMDLVEAEV